MEDSRQGTVCPLSGTTALLRQTLEPQAEEVKEKRPHNRPDGRKPEAARPFVITPDFTMHAEGSVLAATGNTKVICTASVEAKVPQWMRGQGRGWITAEYDMLPRATHTRRPRAAAGGQPSGRTLEIQRLIGRSLRAVADLEALGERTVWIDCDVIQADGGTRTASIAGGFVALVLALRKSAETQPFPRPPITEFLSAVSVGLTAGLALVDLDYAEDSQADVDLNVVMTESMGLVEVQGNAEGHPFSRADLDTMLSLAEGAIAGRIAVQRELLGGRLV